MIISFHTHIYIYTNFILAKYTYIFSLSFDTVNMIAQMAYMRRSVNTMVKRKALKPDDVTLTPTPALSSYLTLGKMLWMTARCNLDTDPRNSYTLFGTDP